MSMEGSVVVVARIEPSFTYMQSYPYSENWSPVMLPRTPPAHPQTPLTNRHHLALKAEM